MTNETGTNDMFGHDYAWTPRMTIRKQNGWWVLDTGYNASKFPHYTWDEAARHARFIHRIRTEV